MVPCQPRQLVILSLPFAALFAFFWYKRRRNSSHSDPGGSPKSRELVDIPDVVENVEKVFTSTPQADKTTEEGFIELVEEFSKSDCKTESEILCNGLIIHSTEKPVTEEVSAKENCVATSELESQLQFFHSSLIEDPTNELTADSLDSNPSDNIEETVINSEVKELESVNYIISDCIEEDDIKIHVIEKVNQGIKQGVPLEEQSTLENTALKGKEDSIEDISDISESFEESSEVTLLTENSLTKIDSTERIKDSSTDTGLGSQEEDSPVTMAQGHNTEEKSDSSDTGLEQKLASLGLDTQQAAPRGERDSANHSPAEVMLNSPAISNFSDAHSEGSSDSGKGCSDVVTPPSRTPAGGSSVAGDQVPIIYEFVLPQVIVGRLIGRHGAFLHDIRTKTHTNVFIKRHPETNSLKICAIEGTQPDIDAALKMIRQKFPQRRFPELTLERVTFVKQSCLPINPENIHLHLVEGVNNDVVVSSVITAGHLFLQLPSHMSYQSLYRLACIMNSVYNTEESPPLSDPQPDMVCVAPAHGGWYRVQILSVDEENNTSDIRFMDYGGFLTVDNSLLRQIRGDFLLLPFQAVECFLANVVPAGGEEWSEEARQFVQLMTTQQTLQAQVYEYTEAGLPLIYLYCTQFCQSPTDLSGYETKVVLLNQELVSHGYADLIESWQEDGGTTVTQSS